MEKQPHIQLDETQGLSDVIIVGDPARLDVLSKLMENVKIITQNREYRSICGTYKGKNILGLSTGIGAPSTAIAVEELYHIGAERVIRVGTAGAYQRGISIGDLIIAEGVVRSDGLTSQYVPAEYPAVPDLLLMSIARKYASKEYYGIVRSHDGFYMDNNSKTEEYWSNKGILGADMESGTLLTVGRMRKLKTLSILNNVVLWRDNLATSVNSLVNEAESVKNGEIKSLKLALDILGDKGE